MRAVSDRHFATNRDISKDRTFLFLENGPNPYNKSNQLKAKIATFLESDFYCLVNLFQMFKKRTKKNADSPPLFLKQNKSDSGLGNENQ